MLLALLVAAAATAPWRPATAGQPAGDAINPIAESNAVESAKRRVKHASPVSRGGIRYEVVRGARARGFAQNGGIIAAVDEATGGELWTLTLYETTYDPDEEADIQDVFVTRLKLNWKGTVLTAIDERGRRFDVDLRERTVTER